MPTKKKQVLLPIYFGLEAEGQARAARLDAIAERFDVGRSQLIQQIADGELEVVKPAARCAAVVELDGAAHRCALHTSHSGPHQAAQGKAAITWD